MKNASFHLKSSSFSRLNSLRCILSPPRIIKTPLIFRGIENHSSLLHSKILRWTFTRKVLQIIFWDSTRWHGNFGPMLSLLQQGLFQQFIACDYARNHLPFFKIFSIFGHLCPNFQILCPLLTFFCFFFLTFFWKIVRMPLLSRIGPTQFEYFTITDQKWVNP